MSASVLVTGGFGAVGSWVVRVLHERGFDVAVYSRRTDYRLLPDLQDAVTHLPGDVASMSRLTEVLAPGRFDTVVHCAAALSTTAEQDPHGAYAVNVAGSLNVFEAARRSGCERVVYTSTKGVYGTLGAEYGPPAFRPVPESHDRRPRNVYGATKKALEDAVHHYRRIHGMEIVALRLGSTFGPGKSGARAGYSGLKSRIVEAALQGEPLEVRRPDLADDLVYNADVGRAHALAVEAAPGPQWVFNISGGELVTIRAWTEEVMRLCPEHRLTVVPAHEGAEASGPQARLDLGAARRWLGYEPRFPGLTGLEDYIERERALR